MKAIVARLSMLLAICLLGGCTSVPKLSPPAPVCAKFDTSDVLFTYGPAVAREQTIQDLTRRIDRYLSEQLSEDRIPKSAGPCQQSDAVLTVRIGSLESVASTKGFLGVGVAVIPHVKMKYVATFVSPSGQKLFDSDDDPEKEGLDELASRVASSIYKEVRHYY
jgi:hypothetical protein